MPKVTLTISGKLPGLNDYTGACRTHPQAGAGMKKKAEKKIVAAIKDQITETGIRHAFINFLWLESGRRRDKDNICFAKKFILDALVSAGVLDNDGWDGVEGFADSFAVDKAREGVIVTIDY